MNLTQLQAALEARGYGTDTAVQQTSFINEVYREICGMQRWPFLEKQDTSVVTAVNVAGYSLAGITDLRSIDAVRIEVTANQEYYDLEYMDPQPFRDMEHLDRDVATPFYWTFINNTLRFYPTPDQAYTVRIDYIMQPADLVAAADTPVLPAAYHDVLVWGAIESMAFRQRDWIGIQNAQQRKEMLLKRMEEEFFLRQRQTSSHVKSSGYWNTKRPFPFAHAGW